MADLRVNVAGVSFENPVIPASGAFGFGHEYEKLYPAWGDLSQGNDPSSQSGQSASPDRRNSDGNAQFRRASESGHRPFH